MGSNPIEKQNKLRGRAEVAYKAHNLGVVGSNPTLATTLKPNQVREQERPVESKITLNLSTLGGIGDLALLPHTLIGRGTGFEPVGPRSNRGEVTN